MIERQQRFSPGKIAAISGAVVLEAAAIFCVATGLKFPDGHATPGPIETRVLPTPQPKVQPVALPKVPLVRPETAAVPKPIIVIETPQPPPRILADRMPAHPVVPGQGQAAVAPPKLQGITAPVSIGASHSCTSQYPAIAQRLNQQGTTTLRFTVNTDGSVSNVDVANSSGHDALDRAAIRCASSWRYKPALVGGQPVSAPWTAIVRWKLGNG